MPKEKIKTLEQYLRKHLELQEIAPVQTKYLEITQQKIEHALKEGIDGTLTFFAGGSIFKNTAIREAYDLDLVVYSSSNSKEEIQNFNSMVGKVLQKKVKKARQKSIGWEIALKGFFHVNVIPAILKDNKNKNAYFYNADAKKIIETNLELQSSYVKNSERTDAIRLMKLWKKRREVPIKNFLLEIIVIEACKGIGRTQLEKQMIRILEYLRDQILTKEFVDPVNQNNVITDAVGKEDKEKIKAIAAEASQTKTWNKIFKS